MYNNYIDKLNIEKVDEKCTNVIENKYYGTEYENTLVTKTCVNLKVKSINDKDIYSEQYRHFGGLKILLIKSKGIKDEEETISDMLDNGEYKVIPYSNYYYKITYGKKYYYISYNRNGLFFRDFKYNDYYPYINDTHRKSLKKSKTSSTDTYLGTYYLFRERYIDLSLIILSSKVEIDGLFEVFDKINLSSFKAPIKYSNYINNNIQKDSLLLYEIKSGNQPKKLINGMKKRCQFIVKYLHIFYNRPIYYFGFYKGKKDFIYANNYDNGHEANTAETSFNKKIENNNNKDSSPENSKQEDNKHTTKSIKIERLKKNDKEEEEEEQNEEEKKEEKQNEKVKKEEKKKEEKKKEEEQNDEEEEEDDEEQNEGEQNEKWNRIKDQKEERNTFINQDKKFDTKKSSKKKTIEELLPELDYLPANIVIFKLDDEIFGEKIKYDKEELNLLGNLRDDVAIIKKDINEVKTDVKGMRKEMKDKFEQYDGKFGHMEGKFGQIDKYFKLIAEKLGIKLDEESKSENIGKNTNEEIKDNNSK